MGADQQFCLRWNNFHTNITSAFESLRDDEDFVDITLACEGKQVKAHKMVLSACSPYFRSLLKSNPCQHPIVFLKDVTFANLTSILDFMYHGEVNVSHNELAMFLKTAEALKVRGLAEDDKKKDSDGYNESSSPGPTRDPPDPGSPRNDEANATDTRLSDSPPPHKKQRRRSGASVQSAEDTNETVLSDIRETSVKNEPQDFNDEDMLGHSVSRGGAGSGGVDGEMKNDGTVSEEGEERNNFGISDSVTISRSQAAMQQLQESFGSFLPAMSQSSGFLSHGATDMPRPPFQLEGVQGLPPGISALPGPSMSQTGASQDTNQDALTPSSRSRTRHHLSLFAESDAASSSLADEFRLRFGGSSDWPTDAFTIAELDLNTHNSHSQNSHTGGAPSDDSENPTWKPLRGEACPFCAKTLSNKYNLKTHIQDKHSPVQHAFLCEICNIFYKTKNSLHNHYSIKHRGIKYSKPT